MSLWKAASGGMLRSSPRFGEPAMKTILESTLPAPRNITDVEPRSEKDDALFAELAGVLKRHGALDRFGVCLLHRHFDIKPGEVLLEETDVESRTQTIRPVATIEGDCVETAWRLGDGFVAMHCICANYGTGHGHFTR